MLTLNSSTTAKQTPRSDAKSNGKQYHHSICTETTNLQPALNASPTRHTLTMCTETICRRLYHGLKQRQNESPLATDTTQFKHSQRHFVLTCGYLTPSHTHYTHPYNNSLRTKIEQPINRVETSEIKGGPDTILFAV